MTPPLLLLGLYLGLLLAAIALASWAGHALPAPEHARRVTDAAERAGLSHLSIPLKVSLGASLVFSCLAGAWAVYRGLPVVWWTVAPLATPALFGAALFYAGRRLLRASGQLLGATSADERMVLTSRTTVGAVLCVEATVGLVLLSVYSLAARDIGADQARLVILVVGSSIALSAIVFARAAACAGYAVGQATGLPSEEPHPGSLAVLVSSTFHIPLLRLITQILVSTLGSCALLGLLVSGEGDGASALWLFPHLLRVLGLFGLLFAGMVSRTSEEESGSEGWVRGAIVYLVLMVAGAWSLSSQLPVGWGRTVPSGLTFLYVSLGLSVWVAGGTLGKGPSSPGTRALARLSSSTLFWGLLGVLFVVTILVDGDEAALPHQALVGLTLSGTLAAVPLSVVWLLARDLTKSTPETSQLAFVGQTYRGPVSGTPSARLLGVLPHLGLIIILCALSGMLFGEGDAPVQVILLGIGAGLGALILASLDGLVERSSQKTVSDISSLVKRSGDDHSPLNFESAVMACRQAIKTADIRWILLAFTPPCAALVALPFIPEASFRSLVLGLSLGSAVLGIGVELLNSTHPSDARRTLANLSFASCLAQSLWLMTAGGFAS